MLFGGAVPPKWFSIHVKKHIFENNKFIDNFVKTHKKVSLQLENHNAFNICNVEIHSENTQLNTLCVSASIISVIASARYGQTVMMLGL